MNHRNLAISLCLVAPSILAVPAMAIQSGPSETAAQSEEAEDWEPNAATRITCRRVETATGSRLPRVRNICLTQRQWQQRESEIYRSLENSGLRNRGNF